MYCPRLDHFVRFNPTGTVSRCGHMVNPIEFDCLQSMDNSQWLADIKQQFAQDQFPNECIRCQQTENINQTSIRLNASKYHTLQSRSDYLIVGGVLDNICNSACQSCDANLSTKIGRLTNKNYTIIDNSYKFWKLPLDRITHLDINGGEPSASKNYQYLLQHVPSNVKSIRINTNCSTIIKEIPELLEKGIHVTVTVSFDGVGKIHDYVRWPIKWDKFYKNLMIYKNMNLSGLNLWTTVHALNVGDLNNIINFAKEHSIDHSYALLHDPSVLNINHTNKLTMLANCITLSDQIAIGNNNNDHELLQFITHQDSLRRISYIDYLGDIL
jgi:sulfatase maturation enzyme AslB (radical SAM superfamily)